ncbi:MAG: phenylpyruvate tautomerase MIF-related protein [Huintestinicola sp.]|uniref:phenylpyruvate tautomerase MIF-related protein n=1 Tax=Huintestinicola sp. TaxID=2981661 RepID=UPI003F004672
MPFINIKTNAEVTPEKADSIRSALGLAITAIPGKSEGWLMVGIEDNYKLYFKGTEEPAAMVQVSIYGNASSNALGVLTSNITGILLDTLGISTDRVYVSYMSTPDWGWNGSNF